MTSSTGNDKYQIDESEMFPLRRAFSVGFPIPYKAETVSHPGMACAGEAAEYTS